MGLNYIEKLVTSKREIFTATSVLTAEAETSARKIMVHVIG